MDEKKYKVLIETYNSCELGIYAGMFIVPDINSALIQYASKHILEEGDKIVIKLVEVYNEE